MPQQLPLPIRLRTSSVFATFCVGNSESSVSALRAWNTPAVSPLIFLYGPEGSGKTHLLQAMCNQAGEDRLATAYLPLQELSAFGPGVLTGIEHAELICVDDVQLIAAERDWNFALFSLHRECDERRARIVMASRVPPASLPFVLPDLSSRVMAGNIQRLQPLDEAQQIVALQMHAAQRGFELPEEVAHYLLRRLPRDMTKLCEFIDELDVALLAAQRRLSVPFARGWLQQLPGLLDQG